jgi:hypothetical protein
MKEGAANPRQEVGVTLTSGTHMSLTGAKRKEGEAVGPAGEASWAGVGQPARAWKKGRLPGVVSGLREKEKRKREGGGPDGPKEKRGEGVSFF